MEESRSGRSMSPRTVLLISIFIAGLCSIVYELLIGTTSSYFLGDSVKHFSLTVGVYMAAMGLGSYLSRFITSRLSFYFIFIELLLAFFGGLSVPFLYWLFSLNTFYLPGMISCISIIGVLTGFEIPLLSRILEGEFNLRENLSNVLSLDYVGALIATLAFPFFIIPFLGLFKASLIFGMINLGIGVMNLALIPNLISKKQKSVLTLFLILAGLVVLSFLIFSSSLLKKWEQGLYTDRIVDVRQSPYQRIVLTRDRDDLRLFIDGNLQFSSVDEYRYHEVLVHTPFLFKDDIKNVLILGGGDGLAVRELLKYEQLDSITVVDLDPAMIELCSTNPYISKLNDNSLRSERLIVRNEDAFSFVRNAQNKYDLIISDLPDPNNTSLARLYSKEFYVWLNSMLSDEGVLIVQSTSPVFANKAFWCINQTIRATGQWGTLLPCHVYVPSFGDWGFVLGTKKHLTAKYPLKVETRFLSESSLSSLFYFSKDLQSSDEIEISTLDNPVLARYYREGWKYWN